MEWDEEGVPMTHHFQDCFKEALQLSSTCNVYLLSPKVDTHRVTHIHRVTREQSDTRTE